MILFFVVHDFDWVSLRVIAGLSLKNLGRNVADSNELYRWSACINPTFGSDLSRCMYFQHHKSSSAETPNSKS